MGGPGVAGDGAPPVGHRLITDSDQNALSHKGYLARGSVGAVMESAQSSHLALKVSR